jgi:hypothetical protein
LSVCFVTVISEREDLADTQVGARTSCPIAARQSVWLRDLCTKAALVPQSATMLCSAFQMLGKAIRSSIVTNSKYPVLFL